MTIAPNKPLFEDLMVGMALPTTKFGPMDRFDYIPIALIPVSYTHLTLPTILLV